MNAAQDEWVVGFCVGDWVSVGGWVYGCVWVWVCVGGCVVLCAVLRRVPAAAYVCVPAMACASCGVPSCTVNEIEVGCGRCRQCRMHGECHKCSAA